MTGTMAVMAAYTVGTQVREEGLQRVEAEVHPLGRRDAKL
jgi:hypothetical protein